MKKFSLSFLIVSIIWFIIPLLLISLNSRFGLPIIDSPVIKIIGLLLIVIGLSIVLYFTIIHLRSGRTTPLPVIEPPKRLIIKGLYKYSRNPMYIAIMITFLGEFFLLGYLLLLTYPLVSFLILHLFIVYIEEPELKKKFGEDYAEYTKKVPRWLPKLKNRF